MSAARPLAAGALYFAVVFAAGFVFGTIRVLTLRAFPEVPAWSAVLVEVPLMLLWSWAASGVLIRRLRVPAALAPRLVMGGVALALLLAAEQAVGLWLMGRSPAEQLAAYARPEALIGLAAQVVFAAMPALRALLNRT